MSRLLQLLPSGPDRVHKLSLREDQRPTIENVLDRISSSGAHYEQPTGAMQVIFFYLPKRSSAIVFATMFVAFCSA